MIGEIIAVVIPIAGGVIYFALRVEHRLTRLESKMDSLLNKNGIDPESCTKAEKKKKDGGKRG